MQLETILNMEGSSFVQLLDESRIDVLTRIYAILSRIPLKGPRYIKDLMAAHVKDVGKVRPRSRPVLCCSLRCAFRACSATAGRTNLAAEGAANPAGG